MKLHQWALAGLVIGATSLTAARALESTAVSPQGASLERPTQRFHVSIPPIPLEAMALMASDVALVRFEGSRAVFPEAGVASTVYSGQQLSSLKGASTSALEIHVAGARDSERWVELDGAPTFAPGEEALVFLWADEADGVNGVLGLARGVYRVQRAEDGTRLVFGDHAQGVALDSFLDSVSVAWLNGIERAQGASQGGK